MKKNNKEESTGRHNLGCENCSEHEEENENKVLEVVLMCVSALLAAAALLLPANEAVKNIMLVISTVLSGYEMAAGAARSLLKKRISEDVLSTIAVIAAVIIGEFFEAAAVAFLFHLGEMLEDAASDRSKEAIESLAAIVSDTANVLNADGSLVPTDAKEVLPGTELMIFPHEQIPLDCVVLSGSGSVDTSTITGEAVPEEVVPGSSLRSGCVNGDTALKVKTTAVLEDSSAARIVRMVEDAAEKKSDSERFIDVFAKYYTPAAVGLALLTAIIGGAVTGEWKTWIYRGLVLLVASCPCAVVLSAPLAFFAALGSGAKGGVIIKGGRFVEALARADSAVFDKTGTLTTGELTVAEVIGSEGFDRERILGIAAECEGGSTHPAAKAVAKAAERDTKSGFLSAEIAGQGVSAVVDGTKYLFGGERLMKENGIDISAFPAGLVYLACGGHAVGAVRFTAVGREEVPEVLRKLKKLGVTRTAMLTGDSEQNAARAAKDCGLTEWKAGLLPEEKLEELEKIRSESRGVIYVGDGINDAPSLAIADAGVAMGLGTRAAAEAADVILTSDELSKLPFAVKLCAKTMKTVKTNTAFAVAVKLAVMLLGVIGLAPVWAAVFADVGTMLITVLNSSGILRVKPE